MKFHIGWKRAITWSFVLLTLASGINLILGARNYFLFYSALDEVQFTISHVSLQKGSSNTSSILIQLLAKNPVDYSGLKVTLVIATTYFASLNSTLFERTPLQGSWQIDRTLPPQGKASWNLTIALGSQDASSISTFYKTYNPNITANVSLVVEMSTFLDQFVGLPTQLPFQQNVTLTQG